MMTSKVHIPPALMPQRLPRKIKDPRKASVLVLSASMVALAASTATGNQSAIVPYMLMASFLALTVMLFFTCRKNPIYILFFHLGSRFVLDSFPYFTHGPLLADSISFMKIYSISFSSLAFIYLMVKRQFQESWLILIFIVAAFPLVLTAIYHHNVVDLLVTLNKWVYILIVILLTRSALSKNETSFFFRLLILCFFYPLLNMLLSVCTGNHVFSAGTLRYIGTYAHQSEIASILLAAIPASLYLLIDTKSRVYWKTVGIAVIIGAVVGIFLTQYRTNWLGLVVYMSLFSMVALLKVDMARKTLYVAALSILIAVTGALAGPKIAERLSPLVKVIENPSAFLEIDETSVIIGGKIKRNYMLSGRLDIWRAAFQDFRNAPLEEKAFGLGINSIREISYKYLGGTGYAHNEYVSSLIETGILGFLGFMVWISVLSIRLLVEVKCLKWATLVSVPFFFATLVLANGTMPFRSLRFVLVLGVYIGVAMYNRTAPSISGNYTTLR